MSDRRGRTMAMLALVTAVETVLLATTACSADDGLATSAASDDCLEPAGDSAEPPPAALPVVPFPADPQPFPSEHTFFRTYGHSGYDCRPESPDHGKCSLDLSAVRWNDVLGDYTDLRSDALESDLPSGHVVWGTPLYSPVDGVVVGCWRNMPDNDPGEDINCPGGEQECIQGGNHVNIRSEDGHMWFLGHLQQGSVPRELCPIDEQYVYDSDPKVCGLAEPWTGFRQSTRLDLRGLEPIAVARGQFIGRVGDSGNSSGPHLHLHYTPHRLDDDGNPCNGAALPIVFEQLWWQPAPDGVPPGDQWSAAHGSVLPIDGRRWILWPGGQGPPPGHECE